MTMDKARRNGSLCRVVLVFGSRSDVPPEVVKAFIDSLGPLDVVMTGGARGVDMVATQRAMERWARGEIAGVEVYPAMWDDYRAMGWLRQAGSTRNRRMEPLADDGIGFRNGSPDWSGTDHMASLLTRSGKPVRLLRFPWNWRAA